MKVLTGLYDPLVIELYEVVSDVFPLAVKIWRSCFKVFSNFGYRGQELLKALYN